MATTDRTANSRFARGSGVYTCRVCKHNTRHTGGDGAGVRLCDTCFELAGEDNHLADNGKTYGSTEGVRALLAQLDKRSGEGTARRCFPDVWAAVWPQAEAKPARILTSAQAEAVAAAMAHLNNVGASARKLQFDHAIVDTDRIGAMHIYGPAGDEHYANQAEFATAYGLN